MTLESAKQAYQEEYIPYYLGSKATNDLAGKATVNLGTPQWCSSAKIPTTRDKLVAAYNDTSFYPVRGIVKMATQDLSVRDRAGVLRRRSRLAHYVLQKVRRDVMSSVIASRAKIRSEFIS